MPATPALCLTKPTGVVGDTKAGREKEGGGKRKQQERADVERQLDEEEAAGEDGDENEPSASRTDGGENEAS